jgi:hypothetical protein
MREATRAVDQVQRDVYGNCGTDSPHHSSFTARENGSSRSIYRFGEAAPSNQAGVPTIEYREKRR